MIEVIDVGEGQTEETFIRDVVAPELTRHDIILQPRLIETSSGARGGSLSRERVLRYLRNTLRERGDTYVTTLFDLHRLRTDFPGVAEARAMNDPLRRCGAIETLFAEAVAEISERRADRFIAHVQPYEFEGLLFSDVSCFTTVRPEWRRFVDDLQRVRDGADSPEHINDGPNTHPSARLKVLQPSYDKVLHGSGVAKCIGLQQIRRQCAHFNAWLETIETLPPLV